ncbi:unnamed protein product [Bursaphelenchus xylophilus]|uniref:(pine wood nematode) hypothetical protein n=1 Tax=Bursaphelenchus xylophilus TaxID=6326 RepID=A0A1I7SDI9_BURXY|nr:unnamed protein product [Bursaphelenchus xylophilus]CAG9120768.1 unnamed protein product [Bursaphelenchus xylophilus]
MSIRRAGLLLICVAGIALAEENVQQKLLNFGIAPFLSDAGKSLSGIEVYQWAKGQVEKIGNVTQGLMECNVCKYSIKTAKEDVEERARGGGGLLLCKIKEECEKATAALRTVGKKAADEICKQLDNFSKEQVNKIINAGKGELNKYVKEDDLCAKPCKQ